VTGDLEKNLPTLLPQSSVSHAPVDPSSAQFDHLVVVNINQTGRQVHNAVLVAIAETGVTIRDVGQPHVLPDAMQAGWALRTLGEIVTLTASFQGNVLHVTVSNAQQTSNPHP
jgi:hypothetical protein